MSNHIHPRLMQVALDGCYKEKNDELEGRSDIVAFYNRHDEDAIFWQPRP